jgi:hypothetical protein
MRNLICPLDTDEFQVSFPGRRRGEGRIEKTIPFRYAQDETFDIGIDTGSPVSADYESPFAFTRQLKKVEIDTTPADLSADDHEMIREAGEQIEMAVR